MSRDTRDMSSEDYAAYMRARRGELPSPPKNIPVDPATTVPEDSASKKEKNRMERNLRNRIPDL